MTDLWVWVFLRFVFGLGAGLVLSCYTGNYRIDLVVSTTYDIYATYLGSLHIL